MQDNKGERVLLKSNLVAEVAVLSVIGDRSDQQDDFGCTLWDSELLVTVCDGMGGQQGGNIASRTAVKTVLSEYATGNNIPLLLQRSTAIANAAVMSITDENGSPIQAGSTLVSVIVKDKLLYWNSVGDSRAYLFRSGELVQFTQDHNYKTVLQEQLNAGIIDKTKYDLEKSRGEALISYLGLGKELLIDYNNEPLALMQNDKIIIMTDGLYKALSDDEICRILDNFSNVTDALRALELKVQKKKIANRDNTTVALIKIK